MAVWSKGFIMVVTEKDNAMNHFWQNKQEIKWQWNKWTRAKNVKKIAKIISKKIKQQNELKIWNFLSILLAKIISKKLKTAKLIKKFEIYISILIVLFSYYIHLNVLSYFQSYSFPTVPYDENQSLNYGLLSRCHNLFANAALLTFQFKTER